ncbi:vesicular-fusion protein SEC17 [Suillus subluteus]|nr:vesicular-fusion protein SEC17 [Suillus subluteus]
MPKSPAEVLLEKADKKSNSSTGWFSSSSTKWEEAGDLYQQAANSFRLEKQFKMAGDAFSREAECREKCNETNDAANAWWNAAKAYKKDDPQLAIQALGCTIMHLTKSGRFRQAADREKEIGQIYQHELNNIAKALFAEQTAAHFCYRTASACRKDAADLCAEVEDYRGAIQLYEMVANYALKSNLTKYSVKDYWLRSGLCALAMRDVGKAQRDIEVFKSKDVTFSSTRECKFLGDMCDLVTAGDEQAFTTAVFEYDQVTKLDNWKTGILLKIKRSLKDEVDIL